MAIEFDSTPGLATSTSYVSVAEAAQYFENTGTINFANWLSIDEDSQLRALNKATQYLDFTYKDLPGVIKSNSQSLSWPRIGATDLQGRPVESASIPKAFKDATCELVLMMFDFSGACPLDIPLIPQQGERYKLAKLDGVGEIERFKGGRESTRYFPEIDAMLSNYIYQSGNEYVARMIRS